MDASVTHSASRCVITFVSTLCSAGLGSVLGGQGRPLTVSEVSSIFASGGDVAGWDEFAIPVFVAAAYGDRARLALDSILEQPSSLRNYYFKLEALPAAAYPRS